MQGIRVRMWGIRVGMQGIGVGMLGMRRMQGITVGMHGIRVGMQGIRVGMWGIRVGMQVYKYLTGILQGFCWVIYPLLYSQNLVKANLKEQLSAAASEGCNCLFFCQLLTM